MIKCKGKVNVGIKHCFKSLITHIGIFYTKKYIYTNK